MAQTFREDHDAYCEAKRGLIESVLNQATGAGFCTSRAVVRPFAADDVSYAHPIFSCALGLANQTQTYLRPADGSNGTWRSKTSMGFRSGRCGTATRGRTSATPGSRSCRTPARSSLGTASARSTGGRGLATEVARAWLRHALDHLKLERIIAFADPRNRASIRVMENIGMTFQREGHLEGMDCVVYEAKKPDV